MDKDGYPEKHELKKIAEWPYQDFEGLMDYVYDLWSYKHYWTNEGKGKISISTGGWSGNESIISALQNNTMFWACCWVSSRRGGHYEFEIRKTKDGKKDKDQKEKDKDQAAKTN